MKRLSKIHKIKPHKQSSSASRFNPRNLTVVALVFIVLGVIGLVLTHAAVPTVSVEPEDGNVAASAVKVTDSTASKGTYVKFKAPDPDGGGGGGGGGGSDPCKATNPTASGFPCAANTGVPANLVSSLTTYTGDTVIRSCGVTINLKIINSGIDIRATNGTHSASTPCVTITNSIIRGQVDTSFATSTVCGGSACGPLVMSHVEVANNLADDANIIETNYYLDHVHEHGGRTGMLCDGWCTISDSYIHDMWLVGAAHMGGTLTNGNSGRPFVITHNTVQCNVAPGSPRGDSDGGCSSDINNFGDFGTVSNVTVTNNLLKASDGNYCAYTGANQPAKAHPVGTNLVWTNNIFERGRNGKCGSSGTLFDWAYNSGNVWSGNKWDDGTALNQ